MNPWKQALEWEELFQKVINKAVDCPALSLCFNNMITPEKVEDSAGNHVFDDNFQFWGITEQESHQIRSHFQHFSVRRDPEFKKYIQDLIDSARELKYKKSRESLK